MTYCDTMPNCPPSIRKALTRIEQAAGRFAVSHLNPCGLVAYYDEGEPLPWRIADDWEERSFATAQEAEAESREWSGNS